MYYFDGERIIGAEIIGDVKYSGLLKQIFKKEVKVEIDKFKGFQNFLGVTAPFITSKT